jgi:hypothetical protein
MDNTNADSSGLCTSLTIDVIGKLGSKKMSEGKKGITESIR